MNQTQNKVNLFIIGFPKTGSTALAEFLSQHSQVFLSDQKGLDFFSTDFHFESDKFHGYKKHFPIRNLKQYNSCFKNRNEKYLIDGSVDYIFSKDAPKNIYQYNPNAKIIILIREPISFIESYFRHHSANKNSEVVQDFTKAFNLEKQRKQGKNIPSNVKCPSFLYYSEKIKYLKYIKRYTDLFDNKNIKIFFYEDWRTNNIGILKEAFKFLNIKDETHKIQLSEVNTIYKLKYLKIHELSSKILNSRFKKIIPYNLRKKTNIKQIIYNLLKEKNKKKYNEYDEFNKLLGKKVEEEINKLDLFLHKENLISKERNLNQMWSKK